MRINCLVPCLATAAVMALTPGVPVAQELKCTQMRLVAPFAAGGANDVAARVLAKGLEPLLKIPIVIENRPGAGGNVGTAFVIGSPADGCTLLVHGTAVATYAYSYKQLSFDPLVDIISVGSIGVTPTVIASSNKSLNSLQDLLEWSKTRPDGLSYGSAGIGVLNHLAVEEIANRSNTKLVHVPYRGGAGATQDTVSGQLHFGTLTLASITPFVSSGQLKILSLLQPNTTTLAPDLVPVSRQGFPGMNAGHHLIVMAPGKTPRPVVDSLSASVMTVVRDPKLRPNFEAVGIEPIPLNAAETDAAVRQTGSEWAPVIKRLNIQLQ
jgi:tripartite-type tricarboxylate transporter receptor subunit TctC